VTDNILAESYGFGSWCVEHGRQWSRTIMGGPTSAAVQWGGGCYQVVQKYNYVAVARFAKHYSGQACKVDKCTSNL